MALSRSQLVERNNWFCGRQRRQRIFFLGRRHGEIFLFDPMCLCSKYSEFVENSRRDERHKKGY